MVRQPARTHFGMRRKRDPRWGSSLAIGVATAAALVAAASACGTTTGSATTATPQAAIAAWSTDGGQDRLNAMATDLSAIGTSGAAANPVAMNTACTSLQTHVEAAQAYRAVPDAEAQLDWSTGLAQAARAATDCIAGTRTLNAGLISQSGQELNAATRAIDAMNTRLQALR